MTITVYLPLCLKEIYFSLWSKRKYRFINIVDNLSKNFQYQNLLNRSQTRLEICKFSYSSVLNKTPLRFAQSFATGEDDFVSLLPLVYILTPLQKPRLYRTSFLHYLKLSTKSRFYKHCSSVKNSSRLDS